MALRLHIVDARTRSFQCDIAGCRNRTVHLIGKRGDVSSRPIHLCDECIRGLYALIGPESPTAPAETEEPIREPDHLPDGGVDDEPVPKHEHEERAEAKPNKARKAPKKPAGGKR